MKQTDLETNDMPAIRLLLGVYVFFLLTGSCSTSNGSDPILANAVEKQDKGAIRRLLDRQVNVNDPQADGMTALHWA